MFADVYNLQMYLFTIRTRYDLAMTLQSKVTYLESFASYRGAGDITRCTIIQRVSYSEADTLETQEYTCEYILIQRHTWRDTSVAQHGGCRGRDGLHRQASAGESISNTCRVLRAV